MSKYATRLSPSFVDKFREEPVPWGPCGYMAYKRTYARDTDTGFKEEWWQTVERGCNGLLEIGGVFTDGEIEKLYEYWFMLKGCPAGRPIWQLGTNTVRKLGGDSMQNCWHVCVNDPINSFIFTFNQLMLGGGVGFNIKREYVYELPPVRHAVKVERVDDYDCDLIVTDNREGWVLLLKTVLESFFFTGKNLRFDTRCIRAKGRPIKSFGGTASGPEDLVRGIMQIATILTKRHGRKLQPIDCMDIMNIIGSIVVAGNVRRSAEIAVGDCDDEDYIRAKEWATRTVPAYRQMSNNTVDCIDPSLLPEYFWNCYEPNRGEPYGLFNTALARSTGRLIDGEGYRPDPLVMGPNPCGEITLESYEACNLAEIFLPNLSDVQEFAEVAGLLFKAAKAIGSLPFSWPQTQAVVERNNRIGISVTGFQEADHLRDPDIFDAVYRHLEDTDKVVSREMGRARSIKLTTVKPSGTLSLLAGVSPGVHPAYSPHFVRRITFAANSPLLVAAREAGYYVAPKQNIDGTQDFNSLIVDFPSRTRPGARCARDMTAIDQLEAQRWLQTHWSDNSVSCTVYLRPHEVPVIRAWLNEHYSHDVKACSFLLHQEHGFAQAPFEEITEDVYHAMLARVRPIHHVLVPNDVKDDIDGTECGSGGCPVR
jgi:ribonucleoside-triphosphate reductase